MALTRIVYISPIISFMGIEMNELLAVRLVNSHWAESVEKYNVDVWRYLFSKYKETNKMSNIVKRKELNWIWYIYIDNKIVDVNIFFANQQEYILHVAVEFNNVLLVDYLIEKDVNMEAINNGNTALISAAWYGHKECLLLLLEKGANMEAKDTALICAVYNGHKECLLLLLEKGANMEAQNNNGYTALICAAINGQKECLLLLLEKGANIEAKNNNGYTALICAAINGHKECLLLLLEKGANIEAKNNNDNTALHYAALSKHDECLSLLLKNRANIEAKNNNDNTALHYAALSTWVVKSKECISLLLENGANMEAKNNYNQTPIHNAATSNYGYIMSIFQKKKDEIDKKKYVSNCLC
jgi:ankyrin repeat protein